jgi:hypothetical protein
MLSAAVAHQAENSIKGLKKLIRCSLLTDRHVKFYVSRKFRENFALLLLCCWSYFDPFPHFFGLVSLAVYRNSQHRSPTPILPAQS